MTDDSTPKPPPLPSSSVVPLRSVTTAPASSSPPTQPAPQQPFAPVPSVATREQVSELAKLVLRKFDEHGQLLRQAAASTADTQPSVAPMVPVKSLTVTIAGHTWTVAQGLLIGAGAVGVAMQVATIFRPDLVSPLQHLQQFLTALGGG